MDKNIITISREFGSGGRYIGEKLAEKLGYTFYDKSIIAKIAEQTGLSEQFIAKKAEYAPSKNFFAYAFVGRTSGGSSIEDYINDFQRKIILEAADKGKCVIVGRCADYILKDREDCINLFIHSSAEKKLDRIMNLYKLSEKDALKQMKDMDKKRSINYRYYTDQEWGIAQNYTLSLDSGKLGYDKIIVIIYNL